MEFSISKKKFLWLLNIANKGVAKKGSTLPILENALLFVDGNGIEITTTDLEIAVRVNSRGVRVVKEGCLTLPCRSLLGIVKGLRGDEVSVAKNDLSVDIVDGKDTYHLSGLTDDEYLVLPPYKEGKKIIEFEAGLLGDMIKKTVFASSTDSERHHLNGVFFEGLDNGILRMVSIDGYRLCRLDRQVMSGDVKEFLKDGGVILPAEGLRKLESIVKGYGGKVKMWLDNGSAVFRGSDSIFGGDSFTVAIKLVDGNFPDYNQLIPKEKGKKLVADRKRMIECLKRVKTVSRDVKFKLSDGRIDMSGEGEDGGGNKAEIGMDVDYGGEDREVKFQIRYWMEFLSNVDEANIEIEIFDPPSIYMVRPKIDGNYLGVIMPRVAT